MSITFDVYPGREDVPPFRQLLEDSTRKFYRFLDNHTDTQYRPKITVKLQKNIGHEPIAFDLDRPLLWTDEAYAWFQIEGVSGGTDTYVKVLDHFVRESFEQEMQGTNHVARREKLIRHSLTTDRYWYFRRSAGQPALINLAYGLIAGSLAKLTDGMVFSSDSAWEWERMPTTPDEFLSWYFIPDLALTDEFRTWAEQCLALIPDELAR